MTQKLVVYKDPKIRSERQKNVEKPESTSSNSSKSWIFFLTDGTTDGTPSRGQRSETAWNSSMCLVPQICCTGRLKLNLSPERERRGATIEVTRLRGLRKDMIEERQALAQVPGVSMPSDRQSCETLCLENLMEFIAIQILLRVVCQGFLVDQAPRCP